jgi:hypothetical protein
MNLKLLNNCGRAYIPFLMIGNLMLPPVMELIYVPQTSNVFTFSMIKLRINSLSAIRWELNVMY